MTTPKIKPEFKDESAVRALYQRLLETWEIGAEAYAECFSQNATYIVGNGLMEQGWQEIVDGHHKVCKRFKSLKRHLIISHDMTPEPSRTKWGLKAEYPIAAPAYSGRRLS